MGLILFDFEFKSNPHPTSFPVESGILPACLCSILFLFASIKNRFVQFCFFFGLFVFDADSYKLCGSMRMTRMDEKLDMDDALSRSKFGQTKKCDERKIINILISY